MKAQGKTEKKTSKRTAARRAGASPACALCAKYSRPNATTRRALKSGPEGDLTFATVEKAFEYLWRFGAKDALHVASAEQAGCDWFLTTDKGILKRASVSTEMRIANPTTFILEAANADDR